MSDSCDPHVYQPVDVAHRDLLIQQLGENGATVTGNYDINTNKSGVKLHADYDEGAQTLTVSITDRPHVPFIDVCAKVWDSVDPAVHKVLDTPLAATRPATPGTPARDVRVLATRLSTALSAADRSHIAGSLSGLDAIAPQPAKKAKKAKASAGGSGIVEWITANPMPSAAIAAAAGLGVWYLVKKK